MIEEVIDRRGAIGGMMGCLMSPFIPALRVPKKLEKAPETFLVIHYDQDFWHCSALIRDGDTAKVYKQGSVVDTILMLLCDDKEYLPSDSEFHLLKFLWERHDHECLFKRAS